MWRRPWNLRKALLGCPGESEPPPLAALRGDRGALAQLSAPAGAAPAAQRLIDTYAPILMLRAQPIRPAIPPPRAVQPTAVSTVLGNPAVELTESKPGGSVVIRRGPSAADIAGLGSRYHLNLPGDPLGDTFSTPGISPR